VEIDIARGEFGILQVQFLDPLRLQRLPGQTRIAQRLHEGAEQLFVSRSSKDCQSNGKALATAAFTLAVSGRSSFSSWLR